MKLYTKKEIIYMSVFLAVLILFALYASLDTFVIPREYATVDDSGFWESLEAAEKSDAGTASPSGETTTSPSGETTTSPEAVTTAEIKENSDTYYHDDNVTIELTTYTEYETKIYVADIHLSSISHLRTAFANNKYGTNVKAKTSVTAKNNGAILAINGDYYGARKSGYVVRNGTVHRSTVYKTNKVANEDLAIMNDGLFKLIREGEITANALQEQGALHVFSFGPWLLSGGKLEVGENDEVGKAMQSNPRTAIGKYTDEPYHYVFLVADGRTGDSDGLTLYQLATFMQKLGVDTAYNMDGGGSSTMYFNGKIVNYPTTNGSFSEREVSDIVYIK